MFRTWILLFASLAYSTSFLAAQTAASTDLTFQVSSSQSWTDTGLDLTTGDVVTTSATKASAAESPMCDPAGIAVSNKSESLPLPSAPAGALIAKLQEHGATPVLLGTAKQLQIDSSSHLFLRLNLSSSTCHGAVEVRIAKTSGDASSASAQPKTRGEQLKSQLATAAQVFMSGQFGIGKSESNTSSAVSGTESGSTTSSSSITAIQVSDTPLDADLRKLIDGLPRRVNDQFNNLGDMVNFVIVGAEKDVQAALDAASWHIADTDNTKAVVNAVMETYEKKDYLAMPMSTLFLFGRKQDFGYEMAEPIAMVASRHHFRIWKAPTMWNGKEVWVGAGTHDIGFAKDKRNNSVTHKIDPAVDGERENIGSSLQKANKGKTFSYYLPPDPVQDAKNATGDGYHSDGRVLVILLQ
jgi:hypothetical protein